MYPREPQNNGFRQFVYVERKNIYARKPKISPKKKYKKESLIHLIVLFLFIICIIVVIAFIATQANSFYTDNYALVIDAESTRTTVYLYQWLDSADVINDDVSVKSSCKTGRLQDVFLSTTKNELLDCISKSLRSINSSIITKPYMYLAATSGMRLLEKDNKTLTDKLFFEIKKEFHSRGWNFQFVGIIKGEDEAMSNWITTNYLKNTIGKNATKRYHKFKTIGILDMDRDSIQIAFESQDKTMNLDIFNKKYALHGKSYLCYGANRFRLKYLTEISMDPQESQFNCFLEGTDIGIGEDSYTCRSDSAKNATSLQVKFINPDGLKCRNQIKKILTPIVERKTVDKDMIFLAVSTFYYYQSFLKKYFPLSDTYDSFLRETENFCAERIPDLPTKFPDVAKYITAYCLVGNYILSLLDFYGFDKNSFKNIIFTEKIGGWPLGYMINETRYIPNSIFFRINTILFVIIVTLCSVFILFVLLVFFYKMWEKIRMKYNIYV